VRAYHGIAEDMKMVPQSARNSRGENLVIDIDIVAKKRDALLKSAVKAHIVPILQDLKRELAESTLALRGELLGEKETLEELETRRHELLEAVEAADQRIKRAEQAAAAGAARHGGRGGAHQRGRSAPRGDPGAASREDRGLRGEARGHGRGGHGGGRGLRQPPRDGAERARGREGALRPAPRELSGAARRARGPPNTVSDSVTDTRTDTRTAAEPAAVLPATSRPCCSCRCSATERRRQ
jgi:hypothetical protein